MIAPIIEDLAGEYEGKATIGKVDVDNNPETAMHYGVRSIPTLLIFRCTRIYKRKEFYQHFSSPATPELPCRLAPVNAAAWRRLLASLPYALKLPMHWETAY